MGKTLNKSPNNKISDDFIEDTIGKIFKILPLYEDYINNETSTDLENINSYMDKIIILLMGTEELYKVETFGAIAATLEGLRRRPSITQKLVKSTVFHCISMLSKLKNTEV